MHTASPESEDGGKATNRLRELRDAKGIRQVDAAAEAGKDQTLYARYEKGTVRMPDEVIAKLAVFYGVSRAYLLGWDQDEHLDPAA